MTDNARSRAGVSGARPGASCSRRGRGPLSPTGDTEEAPPVSALPRATLVGEWRAAFPPA